ncbi:unnamed protein product [Phytomonas sp. Hart1]|nr:unnamed protein product [Phytomonas sp. Hart1]|eukprot:CCW71923.1 unnamed protein product [Phytomonas sp. isolate Hart1]
MLVVLAEGRLTDACLVHFVEEDTPAFELFCKANPASPAPNRLLRVHIFPPSRHGFQPLVLQADLLTPARLIEAVRIFHHAGPPIISGVKDRMMEEIPAMNREALRAQEQQKRERGLPGRSPLLATSASASKEDFPSQKADASSNSGLKPEGLSSGDVGIKMVDGMHRVHIEGLPEGRKKMMLTSPSMTLRTVWLDVSRQVEAAAAKEPWDKPGPEATARFAFPSGKAPKFYLRINSTSESTMEVHTIEDASKITLQDFPSGTRIGVHYVETAASCEDENGKNKKLPVNPNSKHDGELNEEKATSVMICDSAKCCRVAFPQKETQLKVPRTEETPSQAAVRVDSPGDFRKSNEPDDAKNATSSAGGGGWIDIRCTLPDGRTTTIPGLNPNEDTLKTSVRPVIAQALGHADFLFARPYPPKRFSLDEDEHRPLSQIELRVSSTLRVIPNSAGSGSRPAQAKDPKQASPTLIHPRVVAASSELFNRFSRLFPLGGRANPPPPSREPSHRPQSGAPGGFQSMRHIREAEEEKERQMALEMLQMEQRARRMGFSPSEDPKTMDEPKKKKPNHYFGGDSTELIAPPMNEDRGSGGNGNEETPHNSGSPQANPGMHIPFSGTGRRLADESSVQESGDPKSDESDFKKS